MAVVRTASAVADINATVSTIGGNVNTVTSLATGSATLTVAQFIDGLYVVTGTPGAFNLTTPTAALIVAAIKNCQVGSSFEFMLDNGGDNTVTLLAGTGVTLSGTATCATTKNKRFYGYVTNATAASEAVRVINGAQLA